MTQTQIAAQFVGKCTQVCGTAKQQLLEVLPRHVHLHQLHQVHQLLWLLLSVGVALPQHAALLLAARHWPASR